MEKESARLRHRFLFRSEMRSSEPHSGRACVMKRLYVCARNFCSAARNRMATRA
jgi:hypothetical protein